MAVGTRARRGLQIFNRHKPVAGDLMKQMMRPPVWNEAAVEATPEFFASGGSASVTLFSDPEGTEDHCLNLIWLRFGSNYHLPRHSHTEDCLYYVVSGEVHLGNRTIRAGEGFFVPSEAPYTYTVGSGGAEILEFRGTARPVESQTLESAAGWKGILENCREHRNRWAEELNPYAEWCRSVSSMEYTTRAGERKSIDIERDLT
jgi:mannose-6-phosphate isomerase-like protein (cupin superfamily)